ncbi:hypothetical protein FKW77_003293 [Venturia effusa]|uniref:Uncharacterized protein n=1 Tax=Venturia effusa TaxID=50376 RepID=A0A517L704_9PEZI|nr:hypothetical protein FKW77_003293 [Venturia effusa]
MKTPVLGLTFMLASCSLARPQFRFADDNPISQRSKVTAFVVDDGGVSVECWEVGNLLPDSARAAQGPRVLHMNWNDDLGGVDILTWGSPGPIWPPGLEKRVPPTSAFSMGYHPHSSHGIYKATEGILDFEVHDSSSAHRNSNVDSDDDDWDTSTLFSAENGDDWFYFEDVGSDDSPAKTKRCDNTITKRSESPLTISARSSTDTTLLFFKYGARPSHTVLHKGRCNFAGLVPVEDKSRVGGGWRGDLKV